VVFRGGSSYLPPTGAPGRKDDVQVVLQDLPKTGFLLKSPLVFLDKPAAFFAVFDGLRDNGAAADFCARNFHKHLLPRLSLRHTAWEDFELADVLSDTFSALDTALLSSQAQYEGCSVAVALLVGNRVATAAIGGASVLLVRKGEEPQQLTAPHVPSNVEEVARIERNGGCVVDGKVGTYLVSQQPDAQQEEITRIRCATHSFAVLGLTPEDLAEIKDMKDVRKNFRKMSLQIHPDKVVESLKPAASQAFGKLDAACEAIELMLSRHSEATRVLAGILRRFDQSNGILTPAEAGSLLGVSTVASAPSAVNSMARTLHLLMQGSDSAVVRPDVNRGLRILEDAAEVMKKVAEPPAVGRRPVAVTRAMGLRDLKTPGAAVTCKPDCPDVVEISPGSPVALVLASDGGVGPMADVGPVVMRHWGRPRAAALQLNRAARKEAPGGKAVSTTCVYLDYADPLQDAEPVAKKARTDDGLQARVRHILVKHKDAKDKVDPMGRGRAQPTRTLQEAEGLLVEVMDELLAKDCSNFSQVCRRVSECQTADGPLQSCGDLGWITRTSAEDPVVSAASTLKVGELSDLVPTTRGLHLLYRVG